MTLEQMRIFAEAARCGSFTAAAERLDLTQSAVSMSIKKLEDRYGIVLFDRLGKRLVLTESGQVLLRDVERLLADVNLMLRRFRGRNSASGRPLILACTPNSYNFWMPNIVSRIEQEPWSNIDLICGETDEVTAWVMRGSADAGITEVVPSHPQFRHYGVFSDKIILCASPEKAAGLPKDISWSTLHLYGPLLWERKTLASQISEMLSQTRVKALQIKHSSLRLDSIPAVIAAVESGHWLGLVPARAARAALEAERIARIAEIEFPLKYWMFCLRETDLEPLAALVAEHAAATGSRDDD